MGNHTRQAARPSDYCSLVEAARLLGVHYETAARWVRSGKLRGVRLSRRKVVVSKRHCAALLSEEPARPGTPPGSLQDWLPLIGALTPQEAGRLRAFAQDFEKIDDEA